MELQQLPECMLEQIFEFLSYDQIAKSRLVSRQINRVCQGLLNVGFSKMMKRHTLNLKKIKSQLPRRESERRNHALAKHADILTCIETRISMLSMTYTKYIELNLCCFIPGKIIDEVLQILRLVGTTLRPLRAHEVLQELRDISSMAIDHFDEQIAPNLKKSFCEMSSQKMGTSLYQIMQSPIDPGLMISSDFSSDLLDPSIVTREPEPRCQDAMVNKTGINRLEQKVDNALKKLDSILAQQKKQSRNIRDNAIQIAELKIQMTEFRRSFEECPSTSSTTQNNIRPIGILPPIDASTPTKALAAVAISSSAQNTSSHLTSSDSIEVLGISASSSSDSSTSTIGSPRLDIPIPPSVKTTPTDGVAFKNIRPRLATIALKRRIDDIQDTSAKASLTKIMRFDSLLDEAESLE